VNVLQDGNAGNIRNLRSLHGAPPQTRPKAITFEGRGALYLTAKKNANVRFGSASTLKADIADGDHDVRFVPKADMTAIFGQALTCRSTMTVSRIAEYLVPAQKVEHDIVEAARLLPSHGVPGIVDDGPFVIAQVRRPDAHQAWWCQKICVRSNHQGRS
jgi:hypothetical protein